MPRKLGRKPQTENKPGESKLTRHKTTAQITKDFIGAIAVFIVCLVILAGVYYFDMTSPLLHQWSVKIYEFLNI